MIYFSLISDNVLLQIQVIEDDRENRSGVFNTAGKGTVPPLASTPFITEDQGRLPLYCLSLKGTIHIRYGYPRSISMHVNLNFDHL